MKLATLRNPGADLTRLPVGLDLGGISIAEGMRAALACAVVILLNEWVNWPPLVYMALAANLACFCDVGGPMRPRLAALLSFTVLGALIWSGFGLLRPLGLPVVVPLACAAIFCNGFARVWGLPAQAVGNILTVVLVFALDTALSLRQALLVGSMFVAGGIWSTLLTMIIWRLHPFQPARDAVAEVWRQLALLAADMRERVRRDRVGAADWDAHARAHRRAVREAIEQARTIVMDLVRTRGAVSVRGSQALIRLETGEQLFDALIALSNLLEEAQTAQRRKTGERLLRILRPLLEALARSTRTERAEPQPRLSRAIAAVLASAKADPALHQIATALADRLRIAARLSSPEDYRADGVLPGEKAKPWWEQIRDPILANMTWDSAMLRHALRTAIVAAPALVTTLLWQGPFSHWLTITLILTMQPFYSATWQRALERVGGTVLGGLAGAVLAVLAGSPLTLAALMFPLCVVGFAARQVSYGAYIACLTPQVVVLFELVIPGHDSWEIAGMRALFTVLGGALAVAGSLLLWPSWEPGRLRQELRTALAAHASYGAALFSEMLGETSREATEQARRAAGVATNNLEASLSRALQEPRRSQRPRLEAAIMADAVLRRIAGRLSAIRHDPSSRASLDAESWSRWRDWISAASGELLSGKTPPPAPSGAAQLEALSRISHQIELLDGALRRFSQPGPSAQRQGDERGGTGAV